MCKRMKMLYLINIGRQSNFCSRFNEERYSWVYYQLISYIFPMTKLSLLDTCVNEEFLYAYSKNIKAALNPSRAASSFLLKRKKRKKKRKGPIAEKNPRYIVLYLIIRIFPLKLHYSKSSLRAYIPAVFSCSQFENFANFLVCFGFFPTPDYPRRRNILKKKKAFAF